MSPQSHLRWSYLLVLLMTCAPSLSSANPIDSGTAKWLNTLPLKIIYGPSTPDDEAQFVAQLVRYGLDQPLIHTKETRDRIDSSYGELRRFLLQSQSPGEGLNAGIQARVRAMGDPSDREVMCSHLLGWLRDRPVIDPNVISPVPLNSNLADGGRYRVINSGGYREFEITKAAEFLADWQDVRALPRIDSLAIDSTLSENSRTSLARSAARLRDPCAFGFLVPDGHGGIRSCRSEADLVSIKFARPPSNSPECVRPLDPEEVRRLWSLIQGSQEGIHERWFDGGWGLLLEFRDGLKVEMNPTDSGWFNYHDSSKGGWWSRTIKNPALFEAVKVCLPERPLPR